MQSSLDDRAVEILKYYVLCKALDSTDEIDVKVMFFGMEYDHLVFHLFGVRKDGFGIVRLPRQVYESALEEAPEKESEAPFSDFLLPPYVSTNRLFTPG